jgi:hypothetical protein
MKEVLQLMVSIKLSKISSQLKQKFRKQQEPILNLKINSLLRMEYLS